MGWPICTRRCGPKEGHAEVALSCWRIKKARNSRWARVGVAFAFSAALKLVWFPTSPSFGFPSSPVSATKSTLPPPPADSRGEILCRKHRPPPDPRPPRARQGLAVGNPLRSAPLFTWFANSVMRCFPSHLGALLVISHALSSVVLFRLCSWLALVRLAW